MARARNIKPGFFKNELLAECSPWARLCFAGLWTLADREGRLEDRPKRIKGDLFAYDSVEVEPLLQELEKYGFLVRYQNSDGSFIQISKFAEHQTPHYSEKHSVIKPPNFQESMRHDETEKPRGLQESHGHYDGGNPSVARSSPKAQPPDSLIPDSLIPDSPNPERDNERTAKLLRSAAGTKAGEICLAMRESGIGATNPSHQRLIELIDAGVPTSEFATAAAEAKRLGKGFAYALGIVDGRRKDLANGKPIGGVDARSADRKRAFAELTGISPEQAQQSNERVIDGHAVRVG